MSIPTYEKFYQAILELLADGNVHNSKETIEYGANAFNLTQEERNAVLPSGKQKILTTRIGWARTYLKKAGLIVAPARGKYQITDRGKRALDLHAQVDNIYLFQFKDFQNFIKITEKENKKIINAREEKTPLEVMDMAYKEITEQLADNLMSNILEQQPSFFERLVIDLLEKMGYGSELSGYGEVTGKTGDEGIDGIIRQDALGFDKIYVQAKRWSEEHVVGEPDIHQFAGALMGKGANKGLFITTSHFSKQARNFVDKHMTAKIVLIDGKSLTRLMIRYGLGVNTVHTYEIKRVDRDYFVDEND